MNNYVSEIVIKRLAELIERVQLLEEQVAALLERENKNEQTNPS